MRRGPGSQYLDGSDLWRAALLFVALFVLYAIGACRTIYVGDSGELVAAAHTLGIPHPSGYPLYVLLGKLWTVVWPIGSVALRMSLFSAFFGAAAAGGLYWLGLMLGLSRGSSLFGSLLLALAPSFWSQANIQRVYTLNAFFLVVALILATKWWSSREDRWLVAGVFAAALGATNHTFMGVFLITLVCWALTVDRQLFKRPATLAACVGAGIVGLLPYAYLPLRSRSDPRLDWGDPETLKRWFDVVIRREAWERAWIESPVDLLIIGVDYLRGIGVEFFWVGALLALLGLLTMRARNWPALLLLLTCLGNFAAMALHGSRTDLFVWHRYYIPSYVVVALLAGLGLQNLFERRQRWLHVVWILPLLMLILGLPRFDRSRYRIAEDFSRTLLALLPPGAHLAASDDNILFVLIYLQLVENVRPDVDLILQGVGHADLPPLRFDPATDPLYFTHHPNWPVSGIQVIPSGLTFKVERAGLSTAPGPITKPELQGESDPRVPKDYLTQNLVGHFHYMAGLNLEQRDWPRAEARFDRARQAAPRNDVLFYNLGLIYARNGLFQRSVDSFRRSQEINPRHIASHKRVRAADRIAEVQHEIDRLQHLESEILQGYDTDELDPGSPAYHRALSIALAARGELVAARGHRLLAEEALGQQGGN